MMAWSTHDSTIPESTFPWSDIELGDWRTEYLKQPDTLFMSPSPDPSTTARTPTAQPPLYNYQLQLPSSQLPSTPVALGTMLSPALSSSYLEPSTVKRSTSNHSPRSVPTKATATILSPASLYDARCPSPWDDLPVSTPRIQETLQLDEPRTEPSQAKMPCLSRRPAAKRKKNDNYGTFRCEWKGCKYDRLFSRKGVLKRHIETQHINPGAFKCPWPWCKHASSRRENLKAHRQSIHKETF